jgi:hypothetical protein
VVERFAVLPSARTPRLLVPLDSRRVAAASLRRFDAGVGGAARTARRLAATGMSLGAAQLVLRDRLLVTVPKGGSDDLTGSVPGHLAAALGRDDLQVAVYLGIPRPNRKPVLQVMDRRGALVAYAKVGWNDLTRSLVRTEASALEALEAEPATTFIAPRLLHAGSLPGREVLAMTPLPASALARGPAASGELPMDATEEIANLTGTVEENLVGSAFWAAIGARAGSAGARSGPEVRDRLSTAIDAVNARGAGAGLRYGTWHGDWAPWNMARGGGRLFVWDWERSGRPVPVGFDVAHFHHQVLTDARGPRPAAEVVGTMRAAADRDLAALGVPAGHRELVTALYYLELFLRYDEATAGGGTTPDALHASTLDAATVATASI